MEDGNRIASKQVVVLFGIRRIGFPTLLCSAANVLFWGLLAPASSYLAHQQAYSYPPQPRRRPILQHLPASPSLVSTEHWTQTHLHAPIIVSRSDRPSTPNALSCLWKTLHVTALASPCPQCRGSTCKLDRLASFPRKPYATDCRLTFSSLSATELASTALTLNSISLTVLESELRREDMLGSWGVLVSLF